MKIDCPFSYEHCKRAMAWLGIDSGLFNWSWQTQVSALWATAANNDEQQAVIKYYSK